MISRTWTRFRGSLDYYAAMYAVFIVGILTPLVMILLAIAGSPGPLTGVLGLLCAAVLFLVMVPWIPAEWREVVRARPILVKVLWTVVILIVVVMLARVTQFILDANNVSSSLSPNDDFLVKKSHLTGYISGALVAEHDPANLYNIHRYDSAAADSVLPSVVPQDRDAYLYPPPFLLLPRFLLLFSHDFATLRALYYALYVGLVLIGMLAIARWVGGKQGGVIAALTPVVWLSLPTLATLQIGNIHVLVLYVGAAAAMALFHLRRNIFGGAALAFAIVAKVSPVILLAYLVVQRRWRPAIWTAVWCGIYSLLTLAIFGWEPWKLFLSDGTWSKLASGEFHEFVLVQRANQLVNYSPFGLPYKANIMGWNIGDPHGPARLITNIYTLLLLVLIVVTAVRIQRRLRAGADGSRFRAELLAVWLGVLTLASFRAPFGPWVYIAVGAVWLFAVYAGLMRTSKRNIAVLSVAWLIVALYTPNVYFTLIGQFIIYIACFALSLRASKGTGAVEAPNTDAPKPAPVGAA
ncbi:MULTISPECIES: glycosyltransferase family 87 protein [unclassified Nocardia]|uniref:glycosyltransferase family 87 protein n=1 Tax=unclassified Nocardia TaxID=2637762 RepID=UPI001CE49737|nr:MULTISPECIES: glycosyltransferase family 87 protein [unclassified Nocardia]